MLYRATISSPPADSLKSSALLSNEQSSGQSRFVSPVDSVQPTHAFPEWVDLDDYFKTRNGGWVAKIADSAEKDSFSLYNSFTYKPEDPPVRINYTYYFNGHYESQSGAGNGVDPFPVPFNFVNQTGQPTKEHSTRGTDTYHISREPSEFTATKYLRSGGASIQNWLITFPESYDRMVISEITNAAVRWDTWEDPVLAVGSYDRADNKLWVHGAAGVVAVRYQPQKKVYDPYASNTVGMKTDKVGTWKCVTEVTYQSGFIESWTHEYEVTGDPDANFSDIELIPGGWPVATPVYKEDWQAIQNQWNTWGLSIQAAAVQARIDAAPSKPTSASHPYEFAFNDQSNPPADVQQVIAILATGKTAGDDGINAFETLANSGNSIQGALNELNHYASIFQSWEALANSTSNVNLKSVAQSNRQFTHNMYEASRAAHNGWIPFTQVDADWQLYQQYSAWAERQTPNEVQNMRVWDEILGRPS